LSNRNIEKPLGCGVEVVEYVAVVEVDDVVELEASAFLLSPEIHS
jgi:hypothetical protein